MKEPLISVIIPTHNRANILLETVNSVLAQTYRTIEVIIVSDASKDNTAEVIKSIDDSRIKFVELEQNKKYPGRVRNVGIKLAKGSFIAFCDDDDLWISSKLEAQMNVLREDKSLSAVASNGLFFPGYKILLFQLRKDKRLTYDEMFNTNFVITSSILIRKEILDLVSYFDEDERLMIAEDRDLWLRILKHRDMSIMVLRQPLIWYRLGNVKILTSHNNVNSYYERMLYIFNKHLPYSQKYITKLKHSQKNDQHSVLTRQLIDKITKNLYTKNISLYALWKRGDLSVKAKFKIMSNLLYKLYFKNLFT